MAIVKRNWRATVLVGILTAAVLLFARHQTLGHTPGDEVFTTSQTFASLDNGIHDADPTLGILKIAGNLTIANGGSITCDDAGTPADACDINLVVTGNLEIQAGGSIHAENLGGN